MISKQQKTRRRGNMSNEADTIFYDVVMLKNITTKEAAIHSLTNHLLEKGYVNEHYEHATIEREDAYPTGLPTKPIAIAVPHSKHENVIKQSVVLGISDHLIEFSEMGNSDSKLNVGILFLLALKGENGHINYLKNIVNYCKVEENITKLYGVKSAEEGLQIFVSEIVNAD